MNEMITVGEMILRIAVGGLLGSLIGLERHLRAKEAGVRTHFLVGLGSALFMVISQFGFPDAERFDASRIAAQVVSGMGFLGAGLIIFHKNSVRGLTTAAGIWVVSAIGLASGAGMFRVAAAAAVMSLICLEMMHFLLRNYEHHRIRVCFSGRSDAAVQAALRHFKRDMESFSLEEGDGRIEASVVLRTVSRDGIEKLLRALENIDGLDLRKIEPVEE